MKILEHFQIYFELDVWIQIRNYIFVRFLSTMSDKFLASTKTYLVSSNSNLLIHGKKYLSHHPSPLVQNQPDHSPFLCPFSCCGLSLGLVSKTIKLLTLLFRRTHAEYFPLVHESRLRTIPCEIRPFLLNELFPDGRR